MITPITYEDYCHLRLISSTLKEKLNSDKYEESSVQDMIYQSKIFINLLKEEDEQFLINEIQTLINKLKKHGYE